MIWRILVVDDHEVVRIGIRSLLAEDQDITVCSEAEDGLDAIVKYRACNPDIVILDYLKSTKRLTNEIRAKGVGFLEQGYQRELTYR